MINNKNIYDSSLSKKYLSCFEQHPSSYTALLELWIKVSFEEQLLFELAGVLSNKLSFDNPLDFHPKKLSVEQLNTLKDLQLVEILN